jgi:two-component system, chemotaxis family, response regulator WspR
MRNDFPEPHPQVPAEAQADIQPGKPVFGSRRHDDGPVQRHSVDDDDVLVLLVDDQPMIGEAVRRALENEPNLVFHFCCKPDEAVTTAERIAPTVILQDLVMPGIDGLTLVREYRAHQATRKTPIIVLSTREAPKVKSDAFAAGANDYMVKLPDRIELIARIRYHSQAYLSQRQRDAAYRALHESQRQLLAANIELQRLSNMDGLTGLNNRRRFDEYGSTEWRRALRESAPIALVLADIDYFKGYNDTYGHLAGDEVIKRVAGTIRTVCTRAADLPARYGGDEFAVVLPGTPADAATIVCERLRKAVEDLKIEDSARTVGTRLTLSIGCAVAIPKKEDGLLDLIDSADRNLYQAKATGRNNVIVCEMS